MSRSIHIGYPTTLPDALQKTPAEFEREARLAMAAKLFEMKRLSSGQAALLAGIERTTFLMQLSEQGVAMIDLPPEELPDGVRHAGLKRPGNQHRSGACTRSRLPACSVDELS